VNRLPWFRVRRARIALGNSRWTAARSPCRAELDCDESTIWRTCQRYRSLGLSGLLADQKARQLGARSANNPCAKGSDRRTCLFGTGGQKGCTSRIGRAMTGAASRGGWDCGWHQRTHLRYILADVDLQPHRTRYWKTARLDARFKERAEQVLWCYGMRHGWRQRASGLCASMRFPPSKSWNETRSAEQFPTRLSSKSLITHGMATVNMPGVPGSPYGASWNWYS